MIGAQLSGAQLSASQKWQIGPRTVGPRGPVVRSPVVRGPTVQGPIVRGPICLEPYSCVTYWWQPFNSATMNCEWRTYAARSQEANYELCHSKLCTGMCTQEANCELCHRELWIAYRRSVHWKETVNCELRTGAGCTQEADNALWLGLCNHQYGIFTHCPGPQDDLNNCISPLYQTYPNVSVSDKLLFNHQYGIFTRWSSQPWWYIVLPSVTNTARDFDCVAVLNCILENVSWTLSHSVVNIVHPWSLYSMCLCAQAVSGSVRNFELSESKRVLLTYEKVPLNPPF